MKKILILGGTGFVGRILTEELLKLDYDLTLFNRGNRNPDIFPGVKRIKGDRETEDIKQIAAGDWDTVIDFSGMQPGNIEVIIELLNERIGRYVFVSTANVYPLDEPAKLKFPIPESTETQPCTEEQKYDKDVLKNYGNKKAECERILLGAEWLNAIIFRPSLIYGRYDPSDRLYYWLYRIITQDEILIPENGKMKFTNTFSEDFAKIILASIEINKHNKVYNASTHPRVSIKEFLDITSNLLHKAPRYINAPIEFLREHSVSEWMDLPMWISGIDLLLDNSRLLNDFDVKLSSFEESVDKTLIYYGTIGWNEGKYGLRVERERELINRLLQKD
jgi:2'-hydroxyisoflavone reductase